ncbi:hypothetical protein F4777DRAFT_319547 [Nemania sp. FL0916]|nr:hypothetical protein F4777DRAFT_319547 [Nemania sp. FL0916]
MAALTTVFTPSPWCSDRYAVFVDDKAPGTSIIPPSSGWIDPSFSKCIPSQYTTTYPTFSPGICPHNMQIVQHTYGVHDGRTAWTAACCQSGFSRLWGDGDYLCTSSITAPMAFLLDPNISTADVYTTLPPELFIEHDQLTVVWEPTDLEHFPIGVASQYAVLMGITALPSATSNTASEAAVVAVSSVTTPTITSISSTTKVVWATRSTSTASNTTSSEPQSSTPSSEAWSMHTSGGLWRNRNLLVSLASLLVITVASSSAV